MNFFYYILAAYSITFLVLLGLMLHGILKYRKTVKKKKSYDK